MAAAAAFLERAALLTGDPARRAGRALAAAQAKVQAGASGAAQGLLAIAEAGPLSDLEQARLELVRARLASATSRDGEAPLLLLRAAQRLERIDISLARATYLDAMAAAMFAGRLASPGGSTWRWPAPPRRRLRPRTGRARPISSSTAWPRSSPGGTRPPCRCCGRRWPRPRRARRPTRSRTGCGWPA